MRSHEREYRFKVSTEFASKLIDSVDKIFDEHADIVDELKNNPESDIRIKHTGEPWKPITPT